MNVETAAETLGLSPRRVRDLINLGQLAASKGKDGWEITPEALKSISVVKRPAPVAKRKHLIIPDVQAKDGVPLEHLAWVGEYIADKRPDVVVCIGDFSDLEALSSYDRGKKSFEGRRYRKDVDAARRAMGILMEPIARAAGYNPELHLTLGNHEYRIVRAVEEDARLDGTIGLGDLAYESYGWRVYDFLKIIEIDGVKYSHYFTTGVMGRPVSSAAALLREAAGSAVMGHVQYTDMAVHRKTGQTAIMCGTCYLHDEEYLGAQGNFQRRQVVMLHEVCNGIYDPMFVSLDFLKRRYA